MARIVLSSYLVRFPLGGYLSWVLQWLVGFDRLGHDVYFFEQSRRNSRACFDPLQNIMTTDCSFGIQALNQLLSRFNLQDRWSFVDADGNYRGMSRAEVESVFRSADVFIDMSADLFLGGSEIWKEDISHAKRRVFVDGEPGHHQLLMWHARGKGRTLPTYDCYYTVGANLSNDECTAPRIDRSWRHVFYPVVTDLFPVAAPPADAPFTTIMSWQAHDPVEWEGNTYGGKDLEFPKFADLPRNTSTQLEIAVAGKNVPRANLEAAGWRVRDSHNISSTFDLFMQYIERSRGEFSVCKNVFVALKTGWFGDRAAAYLASGRPVVMQDTGFSRHLPCGLGLFAVRTMEEAAAAFDSIESQYPRHSRAAREIAHEHLEASKVLSK